MSEIERIVESGIASDRVELRADFGVFHMFMLCRAAPPRGINAASHIAETHSAGWRAGGAHPSSTSLPRALLRSDYSGSGSPNIDAFSCRNFPVASSAGRSVIEARQLNAIPTTEAMPIERTPG